MDHTFTEHAMWRKHKLPFLRNDGGWRGKGAQNRPRCVRLAFRHKLKCDVFYGDTAASLFFSGHSSKVLKKVWQHRGINGGLGWL